MKVAVIVNAESWRARFARDSFFSPLIRWRKQIRELGVELSFVTPEKAERKSWDVILIDGAALHLTGDSLLERLSFLRTRAPQLVWMDTTDSSGSTQFQVLDFVDLYAKRHLLKDMAQYLYPLSGLRTFENYYAWLLEELGVAYESTDSTRFEPIHALPAKDICRVTLSWTFAFTDIEAWNRWIQMARNLRGGYPTTDGVSSHADLEEVGALFTSNSRSMRDAVRQLALDQAADNGWRTLNDRVKARGYLKSTSRMGSVVSPFGHGEMTYRDFEAAWYGALLLKPSVEHLITFPNVLKPWVTYIPLSWNPQFWGTEVREGLAHENAQEIRNELHAWSRSMGSDSSRDAFINHFFQCLVLAKKCGLCAVPELPLSRNNSG